MNIRKITKDLMMTIAQSTQSIDYRFVTWTRVPLGLLGLSL